MAAPSIKPLGPGTLTVGAVGSAFDFSGQCTAASVTWSVDTEDDTPVLSGATIGGDRTYTATLEATVLQDDLATAGFISWTWSHKGQQVPFTYTPYSTGAGRAVTGQLIVDPVDIGGDIKKKNTSDLSWACVGEPTLIDDLS